MDLNEIRKYIVIVNQGSGCIFQPLDREATYILTAKHVIQNEGNNINLLRKFTWEAGAWIPEDIPLEITPNVNYFEHENFDVAIIKLPRIEGFENFIRTDKITKDRENYSLFGYPDVRRDLENNPSLSSSYRSNHGIVINEIRDNGLWEANVPLNADQDQIAGQSGGAIGKINDNTFLLAGIQSGMINTHGEDMGAIEFLPISSFDALTALHPNSLTALYPEYMGCFSFLKNHSFELSGTQENEEVIAFIKNCLHQQAENIVNSPTFPLKIKEYFSSRLLLNTQNIDVLDKKQIWTAWLEFLTILNITGRQNFEESDMKDIFNSYRLLFGQNDKDWSYERQNILFSDYFGLKQNGLVIVATTAPLARTSTYAIEPGKVIDLRRATPSGKMQTDEGIKFPFDHYRFVHIEIFKQSMIMDKIEEYTQIFDSEVLINKLKLEYEAHIN